jgi:hypothetical protein
MLEESDRVFLNSYRVLEGSDRAFLNSDSTFYYLTGYFMTVTAVGSTLSVVRKAK